jgi:hypothetical protein
MNRSVFFAVVTAVLPTTGIPAWSSDSSLPVGGHPSFPLPWQTGFISRLLGLPLSVDRSTPAFAKRIISQPDIAGDFRVASLRSKHAFFGSVKRNA